MNTTYFLPLIALGVSACVSTSKAPTTPYIVSDHLESAYLDYESKMKMNRQEVAFDSGEVATNCKQYLEYKSDAALTETTGNFLVAQDYVICDSLKVIKDSAKNNVTINPKEDLSDDLLARVDLRSFRSSLFQRADDDQHTLRALFSDKNKTTPYSVQPVMEDWQYEIRIVARVDADGNGEEDWLVWLTDKAGSGSYDTMHAFIAYNVGQDRLIQLSTL